jgi:hypothetical protein
MPTGGPPALPEPLAALVEYLADDLDADDGREFVPTAELADALQIEPSTFARQISEMDCRPTRGRIPTKDGDLRRVRATSPPTRSADPSVTSRSSVAACLSPPSPGNSVSRSSGAAPPWSWGGEGGDQWVN